MVDDTIRTNIVRVVTRSQNNNQKERDLTVGCSILPEWNPDEIKEQQINDPNIAPILTAIESGSNRPTWNDVSKYPAALKTLWRHWDRLQMHGGMLYRKWMIDDGDESVLQLIVPESRKADVLKYYHDVPSAGHLGADKTLEKIKKSFYWPMMKDFVKNYCRKCDLCSARKPSKASNRAPMKQYLTGEPMERIAVDILGPLPLTENGNRYIFVICDCFTKWTEAIAIANQEAKTVAKAFVNEFLCRFGTPLQIHSDQGSNFGSKLFHDMCDLFQIDKTRTTSMRPQANGNVERFNRTLTNMLTMYCKDDQRCWDQYLPQVMMAYRASQHASTSRTPNSMMLGREITLPMQAVIGRPVVDSDEESYEPDEYVLDLQSKLDHIHCMARKCLKKKTDYQKRYYDLTAKKRTLKAGQLVWVHDTLRKIGVCQKLTMRWKGPFLITRRIDDVTYMVKKSLKQPAKVHHIDRLRKYEGPKKPVWC